MKISHKVEGLPSVILGARRFSSPEDVAAAIAAAWEEKSAFAFESKLRTLLEGGEDEISVIRVLAGKDIEIKARNPSLPIGNEDHNIFEALIELK